MRDLLHPGANERREVAERVRAVIEQRATSATQAWIPDEPTRPSGAHRAPRLSWRIDPGRRSALAVGVVALVVALVTGGWLLSERPRAATVAPLSSAVATAVPTPSASTVVVVDVSGKVRRPGVYRLPVGARVEDVLKAAGGVTPGVDLTPLNLARRVADGEQVAVGISPAAAPVNAAAESGAVSGGVLDLNSASLTQLEALPGIGPVLAQHILDWRTAHGRFDKVDQLREVSGIGPAKYAQLAPVVSV